MKNLKQCLRVSAVLLMFATPAFAGGMCDENGNCNCHDMQAMDHGDKDAPKGVFDEAMMKMHRDMGKVKPTANVDVDFVQGMIPHHQGAIDMAETELAKGKDPAIQKLAKDIIKAQKEEIAMMQKWLSENQAK